MIATPGGTAVVDAPDTAARKISDARDAVIRDLQSGAVVVSARHVRLLLDGFDSMTQHIATGHQHYQDECNKVVKLRMGVAMRAMGVDSLALGEDHYTELRTLHASLSETYDDVEKILTYTLDYPTERRDTPDADTATLEISK